MFTIIRNGTIYNPNFIGIQDILIVFDRIVQIKPNITFDFSCEVNEIDATDKLVVPGFIDQHVHIIGGGGEGGPSTRTPEISLSEITKGGITTVIGLLGADGITRNMNELLAKARALEYEGITTYIYSGSYQIPPLTLTGKVISDLVLIDKILGVGEIAISDHRSNQPAPQTLLDLATEARVGGMLGNKAGILHLHVGEEKSGIQVLFDTIKQSEMLLSQFVPTHVNRLERLFQEAVKYSKKGGIIDLTAGISPENASSDALTVKAALELCVKEGLDFSRITVSSDGNGSMPRFDSSGNLKSIDIGSVSVLWEDIRTAITEEIVPLPAALSLVTNNAAKLLKLIPKKGMLAPGSDADVVLLSKNDYKIDTVIAKGRVMVSEGLPVVTGFFEK